jgi:hypothetical protein
VLVAARGVLVETALWVVLPRMWADDWKLLVDANGESNLPTCGERRANVRSCNI